MNDKQQQQQQIDDLLVDWESARLAGKEPTVEQLCSSHPELIPQVAEKIEVLKKLSWVGDPFAVVADPTAAGTDSTQRGISAGKDTSTNKAKDKSTDDSKPPRPQLPAGDLSVAEFFESLLDSRLLDEAQMNLVDAEIRRMEQSAAESDDHKTDVRNLAIRLVEQELLTEYQAKVILERGDSPLLLDRYVILDSIGAGGMGIVFKALQVSLDRIVAVKVLPRHFVDSEDKVERFKREMRSVAKLSHPNVVQAYDAHESNGVYFFAMEYVLGMDLAQSVRENGTFAPEQAADICAQVAKGLASAHENHIVHRDVKPSNILLSKEGVAKVLDLGLARTREIAQDTISSGLTRDGLAMGTMAYMSPEQAFDAHKADFRSDIYSLGCTLYFLIHGKPIFDDENAVRTIVAHREAVPPKLNEGRDDVPPELMALYQRMVAKRPEDRPTSMTEVHEQLVHLNRSRVAGHAATGMPEQKGSPSNLPTAPPTPPPTAPPVMQTETTTPTSNTRVEPSSGAMWKWIAAALAMALMLATGLILGSRNWRGEPANQNSAKHNAGEASSDVAMPAGDFHRNNAEAHAQIQNTRRIAKQLLNTESNMLVAFKDGVEYDILTVADLPPAPYQITEAVVSGDGLQHLELAYELPHLDALFVDCTDDEGNPEDIQLDLDGIQQANRVIDLQIVGCTLSRKSLRNIGALINLESLTLTACTLPPSDLSDLSHLSAVTALTIDETNLNDAQFDSIVGLTHLEYLDVSYTDLSADGVAKTARLKELKDLLLYGMPVNAAAKSLAELPNIKHFDLTSSNLQDDGLAHLEECQNLEVLYLVDTAVTKDAVSKFEAANAECEVVLEIEDDEEL